MFEACGGNCSVQAWPFKWNLFIDQSFHVVLFVYAAQGGPLHIMLIKHWSMGLL